MNCGLPVRIASVSALGWSSGRPCMGPASHNGYPGIGGDAQAAFVDECEQGAGGAEGGGEPGQGVCCSSAPWLP